MSMNDKSSVPNNEEIVQEITEDLQNQLLEDRNYESASSNNTDNEEFADASNRSDDETDITEKNPDDNPENNLDDFVDEEQLKHSELTLTSEEMETRRTQALELKKKGNTEYKNTEYRDSVFTYTEALRLCPLKYNIERSIFYANRAACKINLNLTKSAIEDCSKSIELNDSYVRAYLRRAKLYEEENKLDESLEDFKKILELDPGNVEALSANQRLPPKINERNEKLKEDMLGKLKDLGNLILKPFGLSTNNFNLEQNSETGGYSVNFNQNRST